MGRQTRQRFRRTVLLFVALLVPYVAAAPTTAAPARRLVAYSAAPLEFTESLKRQFEAATPGVTLEILPGLGAEAMIARLDAEKASPRADVMHSGAVFEFLEAQKKGLLAKTNPREIVGVFPSRLYVGGTRVPLYDADGTWYVWGFSLGIIGYNRHRLAALQLPVPRSYADLANPVYKGHIVFNMPQLSSSAFNLIVALHQMMGPTQVWDYWNRLHDNLTFYSRSTGALFQLVARGEVPIALGVTRPFYEGQTRGLPVDVVYPAEGSWVFATAVGAVANGPNPDLARQMMRFIISPDGQRQAADNFQTPIRSGIQPTTHNVPLSLGELQRLVPKIVVVDLERAERIRADVMRRFDGYTAGRSR
ncbi:MAG: extracellular solute-binding protein [Armatimonadetes bacterium]|nr:extracellular solute-binding protein [Armatimonadota bacterium]